MFSEDCLVILGELQYIFRTGWVERGTRGCLIYLLGRYCRVICYVLKLYLGDTLCIWYKSVAILYVPVYMSG